MKYQNPPATVDILVEKENNILLIKRGIEPFKDMWAIPGGHLNYGKETLEQAAIRELVEETGLKAKVGDLILRGVYSHPKRDPRGHVIAHVYSLEKVTGELKADDDAKDAKYFPLNSLPDLAFDHHRIIQDYIKIREKEIYEENQNARCSGR